MSMDNSTVNKPATRNGSSTGSSIRTRFPANVSQRPPLIYGKPTVRLVLPHTIQQRQNCQTRRTYSNHKSSERGSASFVRNSGVPSSGSGVYRAVLLPRTNHSNQGSSSISSLLPQQSSASTLLNLGKASPPKNPVYIRGTVAKPVAANVATSSSSVILNSTSETDKPPVIRVNARRLQCDNRSKPSSDSKSSMGQLQNGHLTSEEAETVRQKSDCRISLTDGAFADFLERMRRRLIRGNAKDYEVPSVAPKSDPDSPPRRPVTRSLCKGKCLDQSSALPKKLAKTSKSTAQQVDWTRYGVVIRSAEFGDLTVCTLCGENSFPFMCIDGFRKHLEVFHSSETQ